MPFANYPSMPKKKPVPVSHVKALAMNGEESARAEEAQAARREEAAARGEPVRAAAAGREVHLLLVVDASGSMGPYQHVVREGLRRFLARLGPEIPYRITFAQFNRSTVARCISSPLSSIFTQRAVNDYRAEGDTALWDAIVESLSLEEGPSPTLCLIASDGEDTHSQRAPADARDAISRRRAQGNWTFLWLNMTGYRSAQADALGVEAMDLRREDIAAVLAGIAAKLGRAVARMKLEGASRIPDLLRLE